ncbi:MAG: cytochrome c-type biogenesis protein [Phototrophicaceae bacterium]
MSKYGFLKSWIGALVLLALLLTVSAVLAQDAPPEPPADPASEVTADQVNAVASQLYCPVCENIPLDTCGVAACEDWRAEIRMYIGMGMTDEEIIDDFVVRFGDRVVGTPQNPALRALSLVTPWILVALALGFTVYTLIRWRSSRDELNRKPAAAVAGAAAPPPDDDYRSRLERDLARDTEDE